MGTAAKGRPETPHRLPFIRFFCSLIACLMFPASAVLAAVPNAPSSLSTTARSSSRIDLAWIDNSSDETAFIIERKTGASGTYVQIATVPVNTTTYANIGLLPGTIYYYRVRAQNAEGSSMYANETVATTVSRLATAQIAAGIFHTMYRRPDGLLGAWGYNLSGQIGDGTTVNRLTPIRVRLDSNWDAIADASYHSLGIKANGTLWAWGSNTYGELGIGTTVNGLTPVQVGLESTWVGATTGGSFSVALKSDGTLWAWGQNNYSQLGDGTITPKSSPVQIGTDTTWATISAGGTHTLALKSNGTLWVWGNSTYGALGTGFTGTVSRPVQIGTDNDWAAVSAGAWHSLALKADGTLWAWGWNGHGQLGITETVRASDARLTPVRVGSDFTWVAIAAGDRHSLGLKADGTLWSWGNNANGQLGLGDAVIGNVGLPRQIGNDKTWRVVAAGSLHTVALKNDETLWTWGANNYGAVGDGTTVKKFTPVLIGTDATGYVSINNGSVYTNTESITLTLTPANASSVIEMQFSNDNANWSLPEAYASTKSWTLAAGEGLKTIHAKFRDNAGNWSAAYNDTIILDTGGPTGSVMINSGKVATNSLSVTLTLNASDAGSGVVSMQFSNDGAAWSAPEPYVSIKAWTLIAGEGAKTVYVRFQDKAGYWSTVYSDEIIVDTTAPLVTITAPTAGVTNDNTPLLTYAVNEGTGTVKVDGTVVAKVSGDSLDTLADGQHTVRVDATDAAGNSGYGEVIFTVDTVVVTINPVTSPTTLKSQAITGSVEEGATVAVTVDTIASPGAVSYPTPTTWSCNVTGLVEGVNNITIIATDATGNTGATTSSITVYGSLILSDVGINSNTLNTAASETATVFFTINAAPATATFKVIPETQGPTGTPVYQDTKTITAAGAQSFAWDGKDSAGKIVADEAYLYVIEAFDGVTTVTYSPAPPTGTGTVSCSKDSYDPFKNDPMTVSYSLSMPARVTVRVTLPAWSYTILNAVPCVSGNFIFDWDGRSRDGKLLLRSGGNLLCTATLLRENHIITSGDTPKISYAQTDPYGMGLSYGQFARIKYHLSQSANVTITLIPLTGTAITLVSGQMQDAGDHKFEWDATDSADASRKKFILSAEGSYTVKITAANPATGSTSTAYGNLQVGF